jgi:hypothetical protein
MQLRIEAPISAKKFDEAQKMISGGSPFGVASGEVGMAKSCWESA